MKQSMRDIEIILIDDGSTDGSGLLCDSYALKDDRIRVIHKRNEGLSEARNDGIAVAMSDFIMFADSDDWVGEDFCSLPYKSATTYQSDVVIFMADHITSQGKVIRKSIPFDDGPIAKMDALWINSEIACEAWTCMYRRSLFKGIRFPAGRFYEDIGTTHRLIYAADRISVLHDVLYYYNVRRPGGITSNVTEKLLNDKFHMMNQRANDLDKWGYDTTSLRLKIALSYLISEGNTSKLGYSMDKYIRKYGAMAYRTKELNFKQKMLIALYRLSSSAFDNICFFVGKRRNNA